MNELLKITKAAEFLGCTTKSLRNWDKSGKLKPTKKDGETRYYSLSDLKKFKGEETESLNSKTNEIMTDKTNTEVAELLEKLAATEKEKQELQQRLDKAKDVYRDMKKQVGFYRDKVDEQTETINGFRKQLADGGHIAEINDGLAEFALYYMNLSRLPESKVHNGTFFLGGIRYNQPDKSIPDKYKSLCVYLVHCAADAWNLWISHTRNNDLPQQRAEKLRKVLDQKFREPHVPLDDEVTAKTPFEAGIDIQDFDDSNPTRINTFGFKAIMEKAGLWLRYKDRQFTSVEVVPIEQMKSKLVLKTVEDYNTELKQAINEVGDELANIIGEDRTE